MTEVLIMAPAQARREWLKRALDGESAIHVAGAAGTFPFLRSLMDETICDVVLVDREASEDTDISRGWLIELLDVVPVVLLTLTPEPPLFNRVHRADAGAILRTDASSQQIICSIKAVAAGLLIFDGTLISPRDAGDALSEDLTPRETEVLRLLAEGLVNREIAGYLRISEHTIKFHIRSILGKLGASTRTEAVTRGLRSGLIEL